jgi:hypothetical protein
MSTLPLCANGPLDAISAYVALLVFFGFVALLRLRR